MRGKSERSEAPQDDDGGRGLQMVWVYLSDAERQDRYDFWCGSLLASPNVSKENSSDAAALAQQQSSGRAMDTARRRQRTTRKRSEIQEDMTFYWKEGAFTGCKLAGNREAQTQETLVADILDNIIMVRGARDRVAQFGIEKARVCCAQEHSTQTLMSTRPTRLRLTVEQNLIVVSVQ